MMEEVAHPRSHACLYRHLHPVSLLSDYRVSAPITHVSFGRAKDILHLLKMRYEVVSVYEIELPSRLEGLNQKDYTNVIKVLLEIAVEIYKKRFPPAEHDSATLHKNVVHTGGELQNVLNLLTSTVISEKNKSRLKTLRLAIKDSVDVSVLPLVYLCTMNDASTRVLNSYPLSQYSVKNNRTPEVVKSVRLGERDIGASDDGLCLKQLVPKICPTMKSCDPLSIKDPRLAPLNISLGTGTASHCFKHRQLAECGPKWLKSFCVDVLCDIYRHIPSETIQSALYKPSTSLGGLELLNPVIKNALPKSSVKGDASPMLCFISDVRNCVDALEADVSDIVSTYILFQDLVPLPINFNRYCIPSLYNANCVDDAKRTLSSYGDKDMKALPNLLDYDLLSLLSSQTKKKARLASLLFKSEEASKRLQKKPRHTRNLKEYSAPSLTNHQRIEQCGEKSLEYMENVSQLFGAHDMDASMQYVHDTEKLSGTRLETVEPVPPSVGISTGRSADCGTEMGGLPPNDLQDFIYTLCCRKGLKNNKRKLVHSMLSPNAISTLAIMLEELATDMVVSWNKRIIADAQNLTSKDHHTSDVAVVEDLESAQGIGEPLWSGMPSSLSVLPYDSETFKREIDLQLQGADLDSGHEYVGDMLCNRMEILFGHTNANIAENKILIRKRIAEEFNFQQHEEEQLIDMRAKESVGNKEAPSLKRVKHLNAS